MRDNIIEFDGRSRSKTYADSCKLCDKLTKELSNYVEVMHRNNLTVTIINEGYIRKLCKRILTLKMNLENLRDDEFAPRGERNEGGER